MYSRAHLLIERDLDELADEPVDGILVFPLFEDNLFDIVAKIEGLPNTLWESGIFQVYLKFNEFYNDAPPMVSFQTIPFHPNIDVTNGRPSLDFLDDISKWKNEYTIKHILQSLQQLLSNPLLDRAVNMDAVFMLKGNPERYNKIAYESVVASQRIQKGLAPFPGGAPYSKSAFVATTQSATNNLQGPNVTAVTTSNNGGATGSVPGTPLYSTHTLSLSATLPPFTAGAATSDAVHGRGVSSKGSSGVGQSTKRVSFEDYFRLWKGIATSKSTETSENIYIKYDLNQNPVQMAQHLGLTIKDLEIQMMQQLNDHKNVMYGKFKFENDESNNVDEYSKLDKTKTTTTTNKTQLKRINQMKETYLNKKEGEVHMKSTEQAPTLSAIDQDRTTYVTKTSSNRGGGGGGGSWENEVDDLVNWTQNLNEQVI